MSHSAGASSADCVEALTSQVEHAAAAVLGDCLDLRLTIGPLHRRATPPGRSTPQPSPRVRRRLPHIEWTPCTVVARHSTAPPPFHHASNIGVGPASNLGVECWLQHAVTNASTVQRGWSPSPSGFPAALGEAVGQGDAPCRALQMLRARTIRPSSFATGAGEACRRSMTSQGMRPPRIRAGCRMARRCCTATSWQRATQRACYPTSPTRVRGGRLRLDLQGLGAPPAQHTLCMPARLSVCKRHILPYSSHALSATRVSSYPRRGRDTYTLSYASHITVCITREECRTHGYAAPPIPALLANTLVYQASRYLRRARAPAKPP